jgi:tetratricopeptide (TPR) repeat protein
MIPGKSLFLLMALLVPWSATSQQDGCTEAGKSFRKAVDLSDGSAQEEALYKQALERCPNMAEAYYNLGVVFSRRGNHADALAEFEKAAELSAKPEIWTSIGNTKISLKDYSGAREAYAKAIEISPDHAPAHLGLGIVFDNLGNISESEDHTRKAVSADPTDSVAQYNLGVIMLRQNKTQDGIKYLENAVKADDANFGAQLQLGLAYQKMGRWSDSRNALEKALNLQPEEVAVHRALGVTYGELNAFEKAEVEFRRAVKLDSFDETSAVNLAIVLLSKPAPDPQEAERILAKIVSADSSNIKALTALGWAQVELGRFEVAENTLKKSISLDANNAAAHNNLGVLFLRSGRNEEARAEFEKAIALDPRLEEAGRNLRQFED